MPGKKRVAVVGSGCSGIAAVWALKSTEHEVHLYEAGERLGGHTNTVEFEHRGLKTKVDTGFIVLNTATYPNFIAFLKEVGVPTVPTEMTFGVSRDQGYFEWAGTSLSAVFAQRANVLRPRMWRMIFDIIRFNQYALDLLSKKEESEEDPSGSNGTGAKFNINDKPRHQESIGDYLDREGYSEGFRDDYLIPMTAAVWSTSPEKCTLEFPAVTLVRFMWNHHLLTAAGARPPWLTIKGGSEQYINAVMAGFPSQRLHLNTSIKSLRILDNDQIALQSSGGQECVFDHVILATHGDQAMDIIRDIATNAEKDILSGFKTSTNTAILHSDLSLMPTRQVAWSAWNYITRTSSSSDAVSTICLTYWMNLLQHIPMSKFGPVLVTLNPITPPDPNLTQGTYSYAHPLYNSTAIRSQRLLPRIQNNRGISYAGAWTKYGFHEDGFSSGLKVAVEHLGAELPFEFVDSTFSRGRTPRLGWRDYVVRIFVLLVQLLINIAGRMTERVQGQHVQRELSKKLR
ncbi:MAG: amine oxidase [Lasallia pustulata]|uniref:Amine oxidase n=1 Tax=Lasallia pustulata TaxID=136370 RepID=A0A5M8PYL4_9LECA|nr:MAG: amine oxidase [Lasallia pustulata]